MFYHWKAAESKMQSNKYLRHVIILLKQRFLWLEKNLIIN
jgi:hypothetical protein